jgi:hypothetical protein
MKMREEGFSEDLSPQEDTEGFLKDIKGSWRVPEDSWKN